MQLQSPSAIGNRKTDRRIAPSIFFLLLCLWAHVCKSFTSHHIRRTISIPLTLLYFYKKEEENKRRQIHSVNLRTVGNYNFPYPTRVCPFLPGVFYCLSLSLGGRGVKDWRRARYVEIFNKNDASVCAKWYGLFFLISLRMRRGRDHLSFFFVFFSSLSYALWRYRMGYEYWLWR